jgi:RNA polymerase sigma-70 factor (ECF subfamily)
MDESTLLRQAQQGNTAAFAELVRRHQTAVFNVALRLLGRHADAEDAAQEAFWRAYQALNRFDVERPFRPWIKRITANYCLNRLVSAPVKGQVLASDLAAAGGPAPGMDQWPNPGLSPEQSVVRREQSARLRAAIQRLPPHFRAVIEYRHFQELSYEEIAQALERPLSSVKSDLFRARKLLAQALKEMG